MKKRLARLAAVALSVCMIGTLAACGGKGGSNGGSAANEGKGGSSGDTVKVGLVIPTTGALAAFGANTEKWTQYAIDQVNEAGGVEIDGAAKKLELMVADSESNPTKASEAANNLMNKVDVMMTSKTADTTVPVAAACERAKKLCLSVDTPDEAWATSDYKVSFHAGFNTENELLSFKDAWDEAGISGGKVGVMHATDTEGQTMIGAISDFANSNGYKAFDPGAYTSGSTDYTSIINNLKKEGCDAVVGVMLTSDFGTFYSQLKSSGYMPKVVTVAKATLFKEDVDAAGANGLADGLCSEVWWTPSHPYKSSISGQTCQEIADEYLKVTGAEYAPATCGYDYANVEILYNVLKNAGSLDINKLTEAAAALDVDTVIGKIKYNEQHYSVQNLVTGQWIYNKADGTWTQEIIANTQIPDCPTTAKIKLN